MLKQVTDCLHDNSGRCGVNSLGTYANPVYPPVCIPSATARTFDLFSEFSLNSRGTVPFCGSVCYQKGKKEIKVNNLSYRNSL